MLVSRRSRLAVLVAFALGAAVLAAVGAAAVWSQAVLADGTNVHLRVVRTVADGFDSGWHTHPGPAIVQVQEGSFQITQGSCTPKTVGPGETYFETPFVPVRAVATGRVVWVTTLIGRFEDRLLVPMAAGANPCP
jgi:quercetin dioxygenase-like cupin family protein